MCWHRAEGRKELAFWRLDLQTQAVGSTKVDGSWSLLICSHKFTVTCLQSTIRSSTDPLRSPRQIRSLSTSDQERRSEITTVGRMLRPSPGILSFSMPQRPSRSLPHRGAARPTCEQKITRASSSRLLSCRRPPRASSPRMPLSPAGGSCMCDYPSRPQRSNYDGGRPPAAWPRNTLRRRGIFAIGTDDRLVF